MKRSIETRDRKLAVLSEKIRTHMLLFDSIEKEASNVKQVVDKVQHLVSEKEELGMWFSKCYLFCFYALVWLFQWRSYFRCSYSMLISSLICLLYSVSGLKSKVEKVAVFEKVFFGNFKISITSLD